MDFLVLFLLYLALVLLGFVMICIGSKTHYLQGLTSRGAQIFSYIIPECLQRVMLRVLHYLFHTRNNTFVILHLILQGMVYTEYTWEIFGLCQQLEFSLYYLFLPYLLLIVNLVFFALTCVTNPGTITKANELLFLPVYEFDEVMFPKNVRCPTCDLRKPARSKHCSNCCSGDCVAGCLRNSPCNQGGLLSITTDPLWYPRCPPPLPHVPNARLPLTCPLYHCYCVIVTSVESYGSILGLAFSKTQQFLRDPSGRFRASVVHYFLLPYRIPWCGWYLFLTFPRIVFLVGFVMVLSFLLGGYLCFCLYLAATNQTTNEWYKGDRAWCQQCPHVARPPAVEPRAYRNIHSRGLWGNLREIFLPATARYERKKK